MGRTGTLAAAGTTAVGFAVLGLTLGRRLGDGSRGALVGAALGLAYLAGTFLPRSPLFGRTVSSAGTRTTFSLTFDDGPDPRHTPEISRELAERGHRATFFVLARAVDAHPELAARLLADGHEIACHGADHGLLAFAPPSRVRRELEATETSVRRATGRAPARLFRPPHGVRSPWLTSVAHRCGYRVCAWRGHVFDTAEPGAAAIVRRVDPLVQPGSIVLLHDGDGSGRGASRAQTVEALSGILDRAQAAGVRSVAVGELVGAAA